MKYMGSKNRIAKYILPIMLGHRKEGQYWVEPFVGGANMIDKVTGNKIGADSNKHCIEALRTIRDSIDFIPKNNLEFSELDYNNLETSDFKYKSFAYFAYSYSGKFKGGWRRDKDGQRDYVAESYRNALKQSPNLQGVKLENVTYQQLYLPPNSLIYCDPPYEGTTKYKDAFNHVEFWQWCRDKVKEGHTIFVSEYNAPKDFACIWSKEIVSSLTKNTGSKTGIEKLFIYSG